MSANKKNSKNAVKSNQVNAPLVKPSKGSKLNETIEGSLRRLFSNQAYAPLDPFKSIIFTLRRKETKQSKI